ncbi:MAG: ThiF family adenylyltransferase [Deltaproteobacteria bacterium]|nr:ThiF family adenylyltransferase [Deltaproteobacteria bacterium]
MGNRLEGRAADQQEARVEKIFGKRELRKLRQPSVAIIGVGQLGGSVAQELGCLSIPLTLVDCGTVAPTNVGTQGFRIDHLGMTKVEARASQISECTTKSKFRLIPSLIENVGIGIFLQTRLIITALDSRASRIRVAEIAQLLGIPMLDLAVDGTGKRLLGTVALYESRQPDAPCYCCRWDAQAIAAIRNEGQRQGCPSWRSPSVPITPPTLSAPAFGRAVAGLATTWAIDRLLDRADQLMNTQIQLHSGSTTTLRSLTMLRSPRCALSHSMLEPISTVPEKTTLGGLAKHAVADLGAEPEAFQLHHRDFVPELFCPLDGQTRALPRFRHGYRDDEVACGCSPGSEFVPREQSDRLNQVMWRRWSAMKWLDLALPASDVVTAVAADGREAHYIVGPPPTPRARTAVGRKR